MANKRPNKIDKSSLKPVTLTVPHRGKQQLPAGEAVKMAVNALRAGQLQHALALLLELTQQMPNYQQAWLVFFEALHRHGNMQMLQKESERCLASKPRFVPALVNLALALKFQQQHSEALSLLVKALKLDPGNSEIHNHLGLIYKELGRSEKALEAFNKCLKIKPKHAAAIWNRADIVGVLAEAEYRIIEALAQDNTIPPRDRAMCHYALARSDEANQDYDKEFGHIEAGAELMRSLVKYNHQEELRQIQDVMHYFDQVPEGGSPISSEVTPIFICGMPRSGTTLVEQIISSHPMVTAGDELNDLPLACSKRLREKNINKAFPVWAETFTHDDWHRVGKNYLELTKGLQKTPFFTDKNLQNYKAIGLIQRALPQAKIILCDRNPMDTVWGCYRQYFSEGLVFSYQLNELAEVWREFNQLADHWFGIGVPMHRIKYENLISDPETEIRGLLDYLDLPWHDDCLNFYQNKRAVRTTSAVQVRQPISDQFVGRWRRYETQLADTLAIINGV